MISVTLDNDPACPWAYSERPPLRVLVAARLLRPGSEWMVFRALQLANFTTPLLLDEDRQLEEASGEDPRPTVRCDSPPRPWCSSSMAGAWWQEAFSLWRRMTC